MPIDGFFGGVVVFLEWVSSSHPFACKNLFIHPLVALCLLVKGSLRNRRQIFLLGLRDVLAVGSPLGFARDRIVVGYQYLFDEGNDLGVHFSGPSSLGKVWKQADVATAVGDFCFSVQLSPKPFCPCRNRCSPRCNLFFRIVMILIWMNNPNAESGCRQIHIPCEIQQDFSLSRNTRVDFLLDTDNLAFPDQGIEG